MAALTVVNTTGAGIDPGFVAAAAAQTARNAKARTLVIVNNGSGGSINVTIPVNAGSAARPASGIYPAQTVADMVVAVPAGAIRVIGPVPLVYNDASNNIAINYSATATVTTAVIEDP